MVVTTTAEERKVLREKILKFLADHPKGRDCNACPVRTQCNEYEYPDFSCGDLLNYFTKEEKA